jgi:hypothetical protein
MANELPKYVFHEEFGEGETINGMQTIDESGDVTNTDVMFEHGIVRDVPVEELMVLEGRGRPKGSKNKPKGGETKPTMPATKTPSNSEDDDSDGPSGPGIHGELLRHQDLGDLKHHEIEFHDGKKVKVSPEHRNKALAHIKSMMGPGKNPDTRMAALRKLGSNHETFKQMIGEQVDLDEAVPYTLGGRPDKDNVYKVHRQDWKGNWSHNPGDTYHSLDDAKTVAKNMKKGASSTVKTKITKHARTKLAGPKGVLPEDVEQVDEISKEAKKRYLGTAVGDLTGRAYDHGVHTAGPYNRTDKDIAKDKRKIKNRQDGIYRATQEEVDLDEETYHVIHKKSRMPGTVSSRAGQNIAGVTIKDKYHDRKEAEKHARHLDKHGSSDGHEVSTWINGKLQEEVEQVDEKLIGKQKNLDKNRNGKLDRQDFKMLRKESVEPKVSVYTEANRFRSVENAVKDIMLNNTNLRQLAKEEEFKRNNPGHFED